jgi:hypothetical protein
MLVLKKLAVWFLESSCEALLLGVFFAVKELPRGSSRNGFAGDVSSFSLMTITIFMWTTGFLLTTGVARVVWRSRRIWLYSAVAAMLFLAHFVYFNLVAPGWTLSSPLKLEVGVAGVCIVFGCTFL